MADSVAYFALWDWLLDGLECMYALEFVSYDTILLSVRNVNSCVSDQLQMFLSAECLIYLVLCIKRAGERYSDTVILTLLYRRRK